jgi:hypothetical protein
LLNLSSLCSFRAGAAGTADRVGASAGISQVAQDMELSWIECGSIVFRSLVFVRGALGCQPEES